MSNKPAISLPVALLAFLFFPAIFSLHGEEITTSDGQVYSSSSMRRSGASIMVKVTTPEGGQIDMGVPITRITKVSFAEPPELAKATAAAAACNTPEVLSLTETYVGKQGEFGDLPGSFWPQMAGLRLLALSSAGKNAEASTLAGQIGAIKAPGSESLSRAGTLFGPLASGDTEAVVVGAKPIPRIGGDQGSALAQLALGRALLLKKDYAGALRAFLTVKVFYPSAVLLQPAALMGAANAYLGLKDEKRAVQTLHDISELYPASSQAPEAKKIAAGLSST